MPPRKTLRDLENEVDPNPLEVLLLMPQEANMLHALNNLFEGIEEKHNLFPDPMDDSQMNDKEMFPEEGDCL